jgi:recombination protein RecA
MAKEKVLSSGDLKGNSLELAKAALEKQFGKGILISNGKMPDVEFLTTGCRSLDLVLGGGIPKGRIVEIFGPESSGKTTITLHIIAESQKRGEVCAFVDMEHAFDPVYASALGVDMGSLLISQPSSAEEALEVMDKLTQSGAISVIILDSVAALVPQKELEGDMGDATMGLQARLMGQAMRKLAGVASKTGTTLVFINQLRMKLGIMFGNPETTAGGNALKFYASQRMDVRRRAQLKNGTGDDAEAIGNVTEVKVIKNKVAPPFKSCEFNINYGTGIDKNKDLIEVAMTKGVLTKSGAWYAMDEQNVAQGEANLLERLRTDEKFRALLESKLES